MIKIPEEVKQLFKMDSVKKNLRVHFPNGERGDITNAQIPEESFSFTESICSQRKLKFGLCEASVVEFECVGVENIKGYEIEVYHEIDISSLGEEVIAKYGMLSKDVAFPFYRVPYGLFVIDECLRQDDMTRRRVVAYSPMNQQSWKLNTVTESIINNYHWKYNENIMNFSVEAIAKLLLNDDTDFPTKLSSYASKISIQLGEIDGTAYEMDVYKKDSNLLAANSKVYVLKEEYQPDYVLAVEEICKRIDSLGFKKPQVQLSTIFASTLSYDNGKSSSDFMYKTEFNRIKLNFLSTVLNPSNQTIAIPILRNMEWIAPDNIASWENETRGFFSIPVRIVIKKSNGEIVHDTGEFDNCLYLNDNTLLYESDSGYFITVANPYKKKITMEKNDYSEDEYEYVKETVYGYNLQGMEYLQDVMESFLELQGAFGTYERDGGFSKKLIHQNLGLYPSEGLYPFDALYPRSTNGGVCSRNEYVSVWYDDEPTKPYDRVTAIYKNEDGEEAYAEYWIVDNTAEGYNASDYQSYSLEGNYLLDNGVFTEEKITDILSTVASSIANVQYMPAEVELKGLPWMEAGDAIEINTQNATINTLVLRRTLSGIQTIRDNYEAV